MSSAETDTLVLIIETHSDAWVKIEEAQALRENPLTVSDYLHQVTCCVTNYQLLNEGNHLAVVASHHNAAPVLYSDLHLISAPQDDASSVPAAEVIVTKIVDLLKESVRSDGSAIGAGKGGCMSAALSRTLCMLSKACSHLPGNTLSKPRVLVLQAGEDVPGQYISCMNAIFSAQRLGIVIDAICIAGCASSFIQQAAHMTGGIYMQPKHASSLLQFLQGAFMVNMHTRKFLEMPKSKGIDFKATCFCHAKVISIGFVCSACLSVFCRQEPMCMTCGTDFARQPAITIAHEPTPT